MHKRSHKYKLKSVPGKKGTDLSITTWQQAQKLKRENAELPQGEKRHYAQKQ
jgi:hypothetical protein